MSVTHIPSPLMDSLAGFHRRLQGQRLDTIAAHHLKDATSFWRLCDANSSIVPDALAIEDLIEIPRPGE